MNYKANHFNIFDTETKNEMQMYCELETHHPLITDQQHNTICFVKVHLFKSSWIMICFLLQGLVRCDTRILHLFIFAWLYLFILITNCVMNIDSQSQCMMNMTTTAASMNSGGGESQSNQGLYTMAYMLKKAQCKWLKHSDSQSLIIFRSCTYILEWVSHG